MVMHAPNHHKISVKYQRASIEEDEPSIDLLLCILKQILAVVENFAKDPRHRNTDSVILSILSHGENGKVIGKFIFILPLSPVVWDQCATIWEPLVDLLDDPNITLSERKCG